MMAYVAKSKSLALRSSGLTAASSWRFVPATNSLPRLASLATSAQEAASPPRTVPGDVLGTAAGPASTVAVSAADNSGICQASTGQNDEFWRKTVIWADTHARDFLSYRWGVSLALS